MELFERRKDKLQRRETYPAQRLVKDSFGPGATAALKQSAIVKGERRELTFYHEARADGLIRWATQLHSCTLRLRPAPAATCNSLACWPLQVPWHSLAAINECMPYKKNFHFALERRRVEAIGISMKEYYVGRPDRLVSRSVKYGPPDLAFLGLMAGMPRRGSLMAIKRDSVTPGEGG